MHVLLKAAATVTTALAYSYHTIRCKALRCFCPGLSGWLEVPVRVASADVATERAAELAAPQLTAPLQLGGRRSRNEYGMNEWNSIAKKKLFIEPHCSTSLYSQHSTLDSRDSTNRRPVHFEQIQQLVWFCCLDVKTSV